MKKKRFLALLMAAAMCLSLAACSKDDESNTPKDDDNSPSDSQDKDNNVEPTSGPDADQYFNTYMGAEPSTLDISRRMDAYSSYIMMNTMEGLVRSAADGEELVVTPGEAESWESNEEGTVWTFHLRDGLKWQDGEPVTAEQYVYSLQRSADPDTACPNSFFLESLLNYPEIAAGTKPVTDLGVKAVDDKTLEITLNAPKPSFLQMLGSTLYYPQRKDVIEKYGEQFGSEAEAYIGNGPFKVESWAHNSSIVLVKNDNYWNADEIKLQKIDFAIMTDESTVNNAFESGQIDACTVSTKDFVDRFQSAGKVYDPYMNNNMAFNFFNLKDPLFANVNIRKAFTLAVDRAAFNDICYDGMKAPAGGFVVDSMIVGETNYREAAGDMIKEMQDELKANNQTPKDLLLQGMKELNLGDDPSTLDVTFSFGSTATLTRNIGEYLQQLYKTELGVDIELSFNDWGIFNSNVQSGNYQAGFMAWGAYYNDPYDTLSLFLTGSTAINTGWANSKFDETIKAAGSQLDEKDRLQGYIDAETILIKEDCVVSPMATNQVQQFYQPYMRGYNHVPYTDTSYMFYYTEGRGAN